MSKKQYKKKKEDRSATIALHRLHEHHGFHIDIEYPRRRHELEDQKLK